MKAKQAPAINAYKVQLFEFQFSNGTIRELESKETRLDVAGHSQLLGVQFIEGKEYNPYYFTQEYAEMEEDLMFILHVSK